MAIAFKPASEAEKAKGVIATGVIPANTLLTKDVLSEALDDFLTRDIREMAPIVITIPRGRPSTGKAKKAVTIRLDQDVIATLQSREDWRSEVNNLLRRHLGL